MTEEKKEYKIEGRPSTIFRVMDRKNPYVMIDRRPIDNPALSFKAKGILTYLMSRPDGWEVNITDLMNHGKEGAAAIRTGLAELRDAHHVAYHTARDLGRITGWIIEVYEIPYDLPVGDQGVTENDIAPDSDFQQVENQQVENRGQVLKNLSINELKPDIYISPVQEIEQPATEEPEPKDPVIQAMLSQGMFPNGLTGDFLRTWREKHTDEHIVQAVQLSKGKPQKYVDSVLVGWEANGYPLTREERIQAAKGNNYYAADQRNKRPVQEPSDEDVETARRILAQRQPAPAYP